MKRFLEFIKRLYNKKIDASGLAIFRILYGFVLLCEVIQIFYFRHLIFDRIPYLETSEIDFSFPLLAWGGVIIFLILGLFTRQIAIINYLFSLVFIATIDTYEYHMFYVYMGVNFLLIFTNTSKVMSFDRLRQRLKYSNTRFTYKPSRNTSVLNYHIFVLAAIAFVYFDSIFYKLTSYNWMNGLGMWLPSSIPQVTHSDNSFFLNFKWLAIGLGYLTLVFEGIFIFTFFRKRWRIPLMIIGIGLHLGILIQFPIPWFGIGLIALYLLMVPVRFWSYLSKKIQLKKPKITFFYDEECPLCNRIKIILGYFDIIKAIDFKGVQTFGFNDDRFEGISKDELLKNIYSINSKNKIRSGVDTYRATFLYIPLLLPIGVLLYIPGLYHFGKYVYGLIAENRHVERCTEDNCGYTPPSIPVNADGIKITRNFTLVDLKILGIAVGILFISFLQLNITYNSTLIDRVKNKLRFDQTLVGDGLNHASSTVKIYSRIFLGITSHPVFMDGHFNNYNHIVALEAEMEDGSKIWLPIIDEQGSPDLYNYSFNWVKWTFRVNSSTVNQKNLKKGIRDFSAFWAKRHDIPLTDLKINVKVKKVKIPKNWEKDFLRNQLDNPWLDGGYVEWKNEEYYPNIKDIESL